MTWTFLRLLLSARISAESPGSANWDAGDRLSFLKLNPSVGYGHFSASRKWKIKSWEGHQHCLLNRRAQRDSPAFPTFFSFVCLVWSITGQLGLVNMTEFFQDFYITSLSWEESYYLQLLQIGEDFPKSFFFLSWEKQTKLDRLSQYLIRNFVTVVCQKIIG